MENECAQEVQGTFVPILCTEAGNFRLRLHRAGRRCHRGRAVRPLYGRDFAAENDILPQLGALSREMLTQHSGSVVKAGAK